MTKNSLRNDDRYFRNTLAFVSAFTALTFPGIAFAAEYCYRHIVNRSDNTYHFRMCNSHGDCRDYPVAPKSTVRYALPDDNRAASLKCIPQGAGRCMLFEYGTQAISIGYHKNTGQDMLGKLLQSGDFCHISSIAGRDLSGFSHGLVVNHPANGDIVIQPDPQSREVGGLTLDRQPRSPTGFKEMSVSKNHAHTLYRYRNNVSGGTFPGLWQDGMSAAFSDGNGKVYYFRGSAHNGGQYMRFDTKEGRVDPGYPRPINSQTWPGLEKLQVIDAAVNWGNGKVYFFGRNDGEGVYIRYDIAADRADPGYPQYVSRETWPGLSLGRIDAAVNAGNGKIYFFEEDFVLSYDIASDRADPGFPVHMDGHNQYGRPPPARSHRRVS